MSAEGHTRSEKHMLAITKTIASMDGRIQSLKRSLKAPTGLSAIIMPGFMPPPAAFVAAAASVAGAVTSPRGSPTPLSPRGRRVAPVAPWSSEEDASEAAPSNCWKLFGADSSDSRHTSSGADGREDGCGDAGPSGSDRMGSDSLLAAGTRQPLQPEEELSQLEAEQAVVRHHLDSLVDLQLCKVCLDAPIGGVLVPCGHVALCVGCASRMQVGSACPFCRVPAMSFALTFAV